jgi:ribosomal protein S18 acetylase RimI-like enzyme
VSGELVPPEPATVHLIEELAANAWPAPVTQVVGGWRLRFAWGVTRRANSVLANDYHGGPHLAERMELVEAFYARRGLPARYQISPTSRPRGLDAALGDRGYRRRLRVLVLCAPLATVLERLPPPGGRVEVAGEPDAAWLATLRALLGYYGDGAAVRRTLRGIGPPAGYAAVRRDGRPLAIGRAVAERGFAGVFSMATLPEARGRGLGTAVLAALAGWAAGHGATRLYLQVDDDNAGAIRLYGRAGFEAAYAYHYRETPR